MFAYCGNNPVNASDPSGSKSIIEHDFGGGVTGYTDTGTGSINTVTVIYNADDHWETAANQSGHDLCKAVGADRYCVVPAETISFLNSWENIQSPYVLIEVHGTPSFLSAGTTFHINISQIITLPRNTNIKCVIITACSSGREDRGETSIARAISTRIAPDGIVICATRNVWGNGKTFTPEDNGMWIIYQNGNSISARLHQTLTMNYVAELLP